MKFTAAEFQLTEEQDEKLDQIVESGKFGDRSSIVRRAIRSYLKDLKGVNQ